MTEEDKIIKAYKLGNPVVYSHRSLDKPDWHSVNPDHHNFDFGVWEYRVLSFDVFDGVPKADAHKQIEILQAYLAGKQIARYQGSHPLRDIITRDGVIALIGQDYSFNFQTNRYLVLEEGVI